MSLAHMSYCCGYETQLHQTWQESTPKSCSNTNTNKNKVHTPAHGEQGLEPQYGLQNVPTAILHLESLAVLQIARTNRFAHGLSCTY